MWPHVNDLIDAQTERALGHALPKVISCPPVPVDHDEVVLPLFQFGIDKRIVPAVVDVPEHVEVVIGHNQIEVITAPPIDGHLGVVAVKR